MDFELMSTVHKRNLERLRGSLEASLNIELSGSDMIDGERSHKEEMDTERQTSTPRKTRSRGVALSRLAYWLSYLQSAATCILNV